MQKWTTKSSMMATGVNKVSLAKILSVRGTNLNEIECWALLGQTAHALQDVLLKANGRKSENPGKKINDNCPVIYPQRVLASTTGRIIIDNAHFDAKPEFIHPLLLSNQLYRETYTESELERLGIYSLGKTIQTCHSSQQKGVLTDLLARMTSPIDNLSLFHVLECVANQWRILVGTSPISRFVAQLCKLTLGWTMTVPCGVREQSNNADKKHLLEINEISHIEFSRLNESSSSSGSTSPTLPRPPRLPMSSSPILNHNNNVEAPPKLPPKNVARPVRTGVKRKANTQNNPSRLYRIVKPITEISINPNPATNRCVGPEFFVMQENPPKVLDLATNFSRKDFVSKQVDVVMLNGQRYFIHVNAASITAGEILDNVLRDQDIKESPHFNLAFYTNQEFWPLSNETKICKIAPIGWKDPKLGTKILETVTLYQRLKFFPDDVDNNFKDGNNKHQFYLQLRQDLLHGRFKLSHSEYLSLAGMALHVEFGDFSHDIHDEIYFDLEHYLPGHLIKDDLNFLRTSLVKLHKAHLGQSQIKTEIKFCKELQRHDNYGFHFFKVFNDKKLQNSRILGIHVQGIFQFQEEISSKPHLIQASFFWHKITRIQYDTGKFQLLVQDDQEKNHKLKFYAEESKSKVMFDLASAHHQHSNQMRLNAKMADEVEYKGPQRPMRSLKSRLLAKRQNSQHKLYTTREELEAENNKKQMRRSTTTTSGPAKMAKNDGGSYLVKRLTHYSSMADALVNGKALSTQRATNTKDSDLNVSDKENKTPDRNYRYKVYLEPEEDLPATTTKKDSRMPLQERPALVEMSTPLFSKRSVSTNPNRRKSETMRPSVTTSLQRKGRRISHGIVTSTNNDNNPSSVLRMGTRISLSALHRERLRLTSDLGIGLMSAPQTPFPVKKATLDLDYDTMEYKSILPAAVVSLDEAEAVPYADPSNESLSESLMERFDNMETDEALPERQIVPVTVIKDKSGRLGLKVTGTASGIYVEDFDVNTVKKDGNMFQKGDRIVAINGRSLENVKYENALEMMRKSDLTVQFLVSQIIKV